MQPGRQFENLDYDENLPRPSDRPGMVEFAGKRLPAASFHRGEFSHTFTTPLENGAVARVAYFHKQKQANVSLQHIRPNANAGVHTRSIGVLDEHGREADDVVAAVHKAHGERPPDMPRSPEETLEDLDYYSKLSVPKHVREDNQKHLPALREGWGWHP